MPRYCSTQAIHPQCQGQLPLDTFEQGKWMLRKRARVTGIWEGPREAHSLLTQWMRLIGASFQACMRSLMYTIMTCLLAFMLPQPSAPQRLMIREPSVEARQTLLTHHIACMSHVPASLTPLYLFPSLHNPLTL
jgi:hypothetical protein